MPAFARTEPRSLVVGFYGRDGTVEEITARDGANAWEHAVHLIVRREVLQPGDILACRWADEPRDLNPPVADWPEPSRASHLGG